MSDRTIATDLAYELAALRRGRGVDYVAADRIGPLLRGLAAIAPDTPVVQARSAVSVKLLATIAQLPERDALVARSVFALDGPAEPMLDGRIERLAHRLGASQRTVQRLVVRVTNQLAEMMVADATSRVGLKGQPVWHVRALSSLLRLDGPTPEVIERRRIVAAGDGLKHVEMRASTPRHAQSDDGPRDLLIDVIQGARLIEAEQQSESHHRYVLELPLPLAAGQEHEYTVSFRVPPGQPMRPYYVLTPLWRCERFDLRVRFDRDSLPACVLRIDGVPPRVLDDGPFLGEELHIDAVGEVSASFERLEQGYSYGIAWPEYVATLDEG